LGKTDVHPYSGTIQTREVEERHTVL